MGLLTASYVWDLESNLKLIAENTYGEIFAKSWYQHVTKEQELKSKRQRFTWLLDSATIDYTDDRYGATVEFEELSSASHEVVYKSATKGFSLNYNQFTDLDGNGVDLASGWVRQQSELFAYWPQRQTAGLINNGTTILAFDGKPLFAVDHPNHIFDASAGVYANWFKGSASGANPGALPIDESVTLDVAVANLGKAIAQIALVPTANGQMPRHLKAKKLIVPSKLMNRATQVTDAKFIAMAAASGGGSADVSGMISRWGLEVVEAPELSAAFGGFSDTTYFIVCEQAASSELGAVIYGVKTPFSITYNDGVTDAQLSRSNSLQWITRGDNAVSPGMPYLIYRIDAS